VLFTNSWRKRQNADLSRDYNWPMAIRPADPPRSAFCRVPTPTCQLLTSFFEVCYCSVKLWDRRTTKRREYPYVFLFPFRL